MKFDKQGPRRRVVGLRHQDLRDTMHGRNTGTHCREATCLQLEQLEELCIPQETTRETILNEKNVGGGSKHIV